jgi:hypothetical protein
MNAWEKALLEKVERIIREYKASIGKSEQRNKTMKNMTAEDRQEVRMEESGERIACDIILHKLKELQ